MARLGSPTVGARVLWRQIAAAPAAAATIFVATLLAAAFVTAVPRILERVSADDLRESLAAAEPELRNVWAETHGRFGAGPAEDPFSHIRQRGERLFEEGFPETVQSNVAGSQYLVESAQFQVSSFPDGVEGPFPTYFRFRFQEGIEDQITLISGDLPEAHPSIPMLVGEGCTGDPLAVEGFEHDPDVDCQIVEVPVFEGAVTSGTAEAMMVEVGDRVFIAPDIRDRLWSFGSIGPAEKWVLVISGIIELSDLSEEFWFGDAALHRPRIEENADFRLIYGTGLTAPDAYREMHTVFEERDSGHRAGAAEFAYTWRYFIDPNAVLPEEAEPLRADLDRIIPPFEETVSTLLPSLLTDYLEQRALTIQLMSTAVAGLAIAALGVVLVLAVLIAERHAGATVLIRDRGASRGQLTLTSLYSGLLLVAPATILGYLITAYGIAGTDSLASGRASATLVAGGTAAVMVASIPYIRTRLGSLRRLDALIPAKSGRRVVVEVFVLLAAAASVALLRRRGLADPVAGDEPGFDALLSLAPAVIGVAVGIVVIRLLPPLMRMFSWLSARGRSLVAFIGLRRLVAIPAAGRTPSVVILVAVAVAIFSWVVRSSIAEGQEEHTWQVVGADFRVDGHSPGVLLPQALDVEALASGIPWAEAALLPNTTVFGSGGAPAVTALAIDLDAYREVLPESVPQTSSLTMLEKAGAGEPIPALISPQWGGDPPPAVGSLLRLDMGGTDPEVVVSGVVDRFPGVTYGEPFVLVDLGRLRTAMGDRPVRATTLYLRAPAAERARLESALADVDTYLPLSSRHEAKDALAGDPFAFWVDRGLAVVFYLGIGFAAVAAVSLLSVTARARRRDLGLLRTLGLRSTQATNITALEQAPSVLLATLVGAATGIAIALLLAPALDIGSFTGDLLPVAIVIEPLSLLVVIGTMVAVLGLTVATFIAATRAEDFGRLLKVGDE